VSRTLRTVLRVMVAVAIVLLVVVVNFAVFTWLYAPVMLALEFTVLVLCAIAALVVRNSRLCQGEGQ
jgi:hypothetical protein